MKQDMSNVWTCKNEFTNSSHPLCGEEILCVGWLHTGLYNPFSIDKSGVAAKNFAPSLKKFANKSVEGYVAVSGCGKVLVRVTDDRMENKCEVRQLNTPCHQEIADLSYGPDGSIKIVMSDGIVKHIIRTYVIKISYDRLKNLKVNVEVGSNFTLKDNNDSYKFISHIKFTTRETNDYLMICISGSNGSHFETWMLRNREVTLHRIFQNITPTHPAEKFYEWQFHTRSNQLPRVRNFSLPTLAVNTSTQGVQSPIFCGFLMAVVFADNSVQLIHRVFLSRIASFSPTNFNINDFKRTKVDDENLQHVLFSPMCCALLIFDDRSCGKLLKVAPWISSHGGEISEDLQVKFVVQLLQHCIVSGCDWWELLINISSNIAEKIATILKSDDPSLPFASNKAHSRKLDVIRMTIYQLYHSPFVTDIYLKFMLNALTNMFRSLILPQTRVTNEDNDPATTLQLLCRTSAERDIDKMVNNLDADSNNFQSMQQLNQWITDVILYFVASVPVYTKQKKRPAPGYLLLKDHEFLEQCRESLVLVRVWGLLKKACMPTFIKFNHNLDVLAHLFDLITAIWQTSKEQGMVDIAKNVVDECCVLPSKVHIPLFVPINSPNCYLYRMKDRKKVTFTFGKCDIDPELPTKMQEKHPFIRYLSGQTGLVDMLRWIRLGNQNYQPLKQCIRCGVIALVENQQNPKIDSWENRFLSNCICGGAWRLVHPTEVKMA